MATLPSRASHGSTERPHIAKSLFKWGLPTLVLAAGLGTALATNPSSTNTTSAPESVAASSAPDVVVSSSAGSVGSANLPYSSPPSRTWGTTGAAGVMTRALPQAASNSAARNGAGSVYRGTNPNAQTPPLAGRYNGTGPVTPPKQVALPGGGFRVTTPRSLYPSSMIRMQNGKLVMSCGTETPEQHSAHINAGQAKSYTAVTKSLAKTTQR
jgi:hypothetical protein